MEVQPRYFQVLLQFRDPSYKNFGKKHAADILKKMLLKKTRCWLKFGSLPIKYLSQKCFQKVVLKEKFPLELSPPIVTKKKHCKNLNEILHDFNLCKKSSQSQKQTIAIFKLQ